MGQSHVGGGGQAWPERGENVCVLANSLDLEEDKGEERAGIGWGGVEWVRGTSAL